MRFRRVIKRVYFHAHTFNTYQYSGSYWGFRPHKPVMCQTESNIETNIEISFGNVRFGNNQIIYVLLFQMFVFVLTFSFQMVT